MAAQSRRDGRYWRAPMAPTHRPSALYFCIAGLSWPVLRARFRLRARGRSTSPRRRFVLAANHYSNFDPWPLGLPLFPRRFLRFMAKSELFWFPLSLVITAGGGFRVRRGERDRRRSTTAVRLCREGHVVVMFPEGTRRKKGLRKTARGALALGRRADRARGGRPARAGGDHRHRPPQPARAACASPTARRSRSTTSARATCGDAADAATERLQRGDRRARGVARDEAGRCLSSTATRSRTAPSTRLPRVDPPRRRRAGKRARRLHEHAAAALAGGAAARRRRRLGHAHRADLPHTRRWPATRPAASSTPSCSSSSTCCPMLVVGHGHRLREGARLRGRRLPRRRRRSRGGARRLRARRHVRPRRLPARQRPTSRSSSRSRGVSQIARIGPDEVRRALRRRAGPGARLHRAARRPVRPDPRRARRRREDGGVACSQTYGSLEATARRGPLRRRGRAAAPLPPHRDARPDRAAAPARRPRARLGGGCAQPRASSGLEAARRAARGGGPGRADRPSGARPAPSDGGRIPRRGERIAALLAALRACGRACRAPARGDRARARPARTSTRSRRSTTEPGSTPTRSPGRRPGRRRSSPPACAIEAVEPRRLRARPPARAPRPAGPRDGLLHLRQRRAIAARHAHAELGRRARRDRRLGRPPRERHRGDSCAAIRRSSSSRSTSGRSTPAPAGRARATSERPQRPARRRLRRRRVRGGVRRSVEPSCAGSSPSSCSSRRASTPTRRPARRDGVTAAGFRRPRRRLRALAPRVAAVLEGGYNLETLPALVEAALDGFARRARWPNGNGR